jgi:hypothetical protein
MHDGLSAVFAAIVDHTEAVLQPFCLGDLGNRLKALGNIAGILLVDSSGAADILLGNYQEVYRSLGIDIPKGKNVLIFIDLGAGNLTVDNLAEQAILIHDAPPYSLS